MRIQYILIIITLSIFPFNYGFSQSIETKSFTLYSLANESEKVIVEFDDINDRISFILNSKEKLCINDYRGIVGNIRILDKRFLAIKYKIRGGTGVKMEMTTLVCTSKGKLYKALDILSTESYKFKDTYDKATDSLKLYNEAGIYSLKLINIRDMNQSFELTAIQYQKRKSKYDKKENYEKLDTVKLRFDKKYKVFYKKYINLKGIYKIGGVKQEYRTFNGESYPFLNMRNDKYIFIDKIWYNKLPGNHLVEVANI